MQMVKVRHLPKFLAMGHMVTKLWWFNSLQDGVRPPSWSLKSLKL